MKKITEVGTNMFHILSEPGDMTRYDYFCFVNYDEFCFMPCGSTFRFPQRLNRFDVKNLEDEELQKMAEEQFCNPCTLKECIRTIEAELKEKKEEEKRIEAEEKARIEAELKKGDKDKVKDLINDLNLMKAKYNFDSDSNKKMYEDTCLLLDKIVVHIKKYL